nr:tRNA (5-methylaminomethyl-2-thiouridine)(34)-methyltransferase MnmD [uncultured Carboxylicivirga sp.]
MIRNSNREIKLIESADGSHTLYVPELEEHYHSVNGAINESMHVFIEPNLKYCTLPRVSVLEIGFGTGLNALLTAIHQGEKDVLYHSLEKYPIEESLAKQLNYCHNAEEKQLFEKMHQAEWQTESVINQHFTLLKDETDLLTVDFSRKYDLVYFDAFAPEKQPEMWAPELFQKIYDAMNDGGILTTYCAKGVVRRTMQACGFSVERLPGPKGKREMLRATK